MSKSFKPGNNIAMKVPPHEYNATVAFYRDTLGFTELTPEGETTPRFDFGGKVLWIDRVETCSQAEIWLEVICDEPFKAEDYLEKQGVVRCDDIEPLPEGFQGFWMKNPANIVHLVVSSDE